MWLKWLKEYHDARISGSNENHKRKTKFDRKAQQTQAPLTCTGPHAVSYKK